MKINDKPIKVSITFENLDHEYETLKNNIPFVDLKNLIENKNPYFDMSYFDEYENSNIFINANKIFSIAYDKNLYKKYLLIYKMENTLERLDEKKLIKEKLNKNVLKELIDEVYKDLKETINS